jgi:hypothetical protein
MRRRRAKALGLVAAVALALVAAGCGRDDFANDPRPPIPAEVTVKIATDGVAVSPKEFGAGLVNFTIANLTTTPGTLVIQGPVQAESDQVPPAGTATIKTEVKEGSYEASVDGVNARPFQFTVGPERPSGQNDLLLP